MRLIARFLGFALRDRRDAFRGWRGRRGDPDLEVRTGPARLYPAQELRAAGDDPGSRGRWLACSPNMPRNGVSICPSSAIPPLVKEAFISAEDKNFYIHQRRRSRRPDPRRVSCFLQGSKPRSGRFDHHPAGRQELLSQQRALVRAQDPRSAAVHSASRRPIRRRRSSSSISTKFISASAITGSPRRR